MDNRRHQANATRYGPVNNHSWVTPVSTLLILAVLIAGALMISTVTRRHVQLDDGTIWVTSLGNQKAARFNVKNREADASVASSAPRFDVAQHDGITILTEPTTASSIAASTVSIDSQTNFKANTIAVVGGGTIAFINEKTGNVWAGLADGLNAISPITSDPHMRLGAGGRIAVTHDGTVYGYRPSDGMVLKLEYSNGFEVEQVESLTEGQQQAADSFTVIDDAPIISSGNTIIHTFGQFTIDGTGPITLQTPPTDGQQSGWAAASSSRGIIVTRLSSNAKPKFHSTGGKGEAARPVSVNGCVHAAWSQQAHNYLEICTPNYADLTFQTLESVNETSELIFRANHRLVILNDVIDGTVWNPTEDIAAITIQWNQIQTQHNDVAKQDNDSATNHQNFSTTCSAQSGEIKAEDDAIGVRTGSKHILDVLRNDEQTDCSVLRIVKVGASQGGNVTISPIYDGRYLQLDASSASAGTVTFSYTIGDGRNQTSTANVTVTLRDEGNHAPVQFDTPPEIDVEQGSSYTTNALASFSDPDGDPLTLVTAVAQHTDQVRVSTRADGQLTFTTGTLTSGRVGIAITVSDGTATGTGLMYFSVKPPNTLAAVIDPVTKTAIPDTDSVITLSPYVHGTSAQPAQLSHVDTPAGTSTSMHAADMSIAFKASQPGTYYVPYTIIQGSIPATGLIRVEVQPVTRETAKPVAANDVALLGLNNTAIMEPLSNDIDPMGGVLSITAAEAPADSGIKVGVVNHKRVYITARQVPSQPMPISYTVANATGTAAGTIILHPPTSTATGSIPQAGNISSQVRTGSVVSVNVLDHVTHSDSTSVTLSNNLQYDESTFRGLVFASGDTVRYQATNQTGTYPVTYTVEDEFGNAASAIITITVHESRADGKAAPTPHDVEAQVAAGQQARIPIPLTGIDVDGDDCQLLGLGNKAPTMGRITEVGSDYLMYEAYPDSSGTDIFSYAVEDWTGQRAQAQIRVGVFQGASDSSVYARDDHITLRPNTTATVPVTLNDIAADNTHLTISEEIEVQGLENAQVTNNMLSFTTPEHDTTAYIAYTVHNQAGLTDTATLIVTVDANASIEPPTTYDYRVPASATIDKQSVDVDVSPWIDNPSGPISELAVSVHSSATDHARVTGGNASTIITIELTSQARAIPYTVINTTHHVESTAFIQVPAYGVFPPMPRPKAPELTVNARETIHININDHVRVGAGKEPYLESADSISATKASNTDFYVNDKTVKFTADKDYAGPASITFTVADGNQSGTTTIVSTAVITLPITVIGRETLPPTFSSSTIDIEAGAEPKAIDLTALTHAPAGLNDNDKRYSYSTGNPTSRHISSTLSGSGKLQISASQDAPPGTAASIPIQISYGRSTVNAGITVRVVESTRPLARLDAKTLQLKAGSSGSVNLLEGSYNPFPDSPLRVTECRVDDKAKLTVKACSSEAITINAADGIGASSNTVLVTVQDGTATESREVTGAITVSTIDKPDAPMLFPVTGNPQDGTVSLNWMASAPNGSPIIEYRVRWTGNTNGEQSCGTATTCQVTGLKNGEAYSFTVAANNEVGWSAASVTVTATPDKVPTAPLNVTVEGGNAKAVVMWTPLDGNFSAVDNYIVTVSGVGTPQTKETGNATTTKLVFSFSNDDIADGATVTATVRAHNNVNWGPESTAAEPKMLWGNPDPPHIELVGNGNTITANITPGNNHNAGCERIELSGDTTDTVDCAGGTVSFGPSEKTPSNGKVTVKATLVPLRDARAATAIAIFDSPTSRTTNTTQEKIMTPTIDDATYLSDATLLSDITYPSDATHLAELRHQQLPNTADREPHQNISLPNLNQHPENTHSGMIAQPTADIRYFQQSFDTLVNNISKVISGKTTPIRHCIIALIAGGHVLLEDNPGTGKTQLARALANSIDTSFKRIQFTPDLLPSDVVGVTFYDQKHGEFEFRKGPVFASIVLADEINRASPKTQSALLEVMEEQKVTVDGTTHDMPQPFIVIATQNPADQLGTYPLPEAQMDRFLLRTSIGHPGHHVSLDILKQIDIVDRAQTISPVLSGNDVLRLRQLAASVHIDDAIREYIVRLVEATRHHESIIAGSSMRGALALARSSRIQAAADGRSYVVPDDVKNLAMPALAHRITLTDEAIFEGTTQNSLMTRILEDVPTPPANT